MKVMMFSKKGNVFCDFAEAILKSYFKSDEYMSIRGDVGDWLDDELYWYKPEYIISFLSPWIIPKKFLDAAQNAAVNFHPGPPQYPGTGCYNFALYEGSKRYGITVHHMKEKVDTGEIIMTSYFDISPYESVETLKLKSMNHLLYCFEKIAAHISIGQPLPVSAEKWSRRPFTRKEMYELFEVNPAVQDREEIERRIHAAEYPGMPGAYVMANGHKFFLPYDDRPSIVG